MGSQQLLLIVLGVIVIGLMVVAGISIFSAYSESSNREQIIASLYDLGLMAQTHFKKQEVAGGGGGTFSGWDIPQNLKYTEIGTFAANVNANRVNLSCNGKHKGLNGSTLIRVTARIDETGIRINVLN